MAVPDDEDKSPPRAVATGELTPAGADGHVATKPLEQTRPALSVNRLSLKESPRDRRRRRIAGQTLKNDCNPQMGP
jgi:hypothetical protein